MPQRNYLIIAALVCHLLTGCAEPQQGYHIVVIPKGMTHEFWQSIRRGARRAAADLTSAGVATDEPIFDGPLRERDALAQIRIVDRRISTRVDGIVLAPQHSQTMVPAVERAVEQHIPVVIIDSGLEQPDLYIRYVATDNRNGGRLAARHLIEVLRKDGRPNPRLILFRYDIGSESTMQREAGFEDHIAEQEKAGRLQVIWVSRDKYAGATKETALKEAAPLLNKVRDRVDGIFAVNESSAAGMLDALRNLGLSRLVQRTPGQPSDEALKQAVADGLVGNDILTDGVAEADTRLLADAERMDKLGLRKAIRLMGFDSSEPLLQAVSTGEMDGLILQDPYKMGYLGVWTVVRYLQGDDVSVEPEPPYPGVKGKDLSTGEHVITRANLNSPSTIELFNPAAQEKRTIATPHWPRRK
jgi:ribose transport system substrate-binding protein